MNESRSERVEERESESLDSSSRKHTPFTNLVNVRLSNLLRQNGYYVGGVKKGERSKAGGTSSAIQQILWVCV